MNSIPGLMISRLGIESDCIKLFPVAGKDVICVGSPDFGGSRQTVENTDTLREDDDGSDSLLVLVAAGDRTISSYFQQAINLPRGADSLAKGTVYAKDGTIASIVRLIRLYVDQTVTMQYCDGSAAQLTFVGDGKFDYKVTRTIDAGLKAWKEHNPSNLKLPPVKYGEALQKAA